MTIFEEKDSRMTIFNKARIILLHNIVTLCYNGILYLHQSKHFFIKVFFLEKSKCVQWLWPKKVNTLRTMPCLIRLTIMVYVFLASLYIWFLKWITNIFRLQHVLLGLIFSCLIRENINWEIDWGNWFLFALVSVSTIMTKFYVSPCKA